MANYTKNLITFQNREEEDYPGSGLYPGGGGNSHGLLPGVLLLRSSAVRSWCSVSWRLRPRMRVRYIHVLVKMIKILDRQIASFHHVQS